MPVQPPTIEALQAIAEQYGLMVTDEELAEYRRHMAGTLASYHRLDDLVEPKPAVRYPRTPGYRPSLDENQLNAWAWRCSIKGDGVGKLAGKRVAIKDNVCVAGVPMMNGCSLLEGFVPDIDATVVTRILDAGGEIIGKSVCEHLSFSGGSHTSDTGPVLNPHNPTRSAGGSSGGSAALVVSGEADIAIGADQGGSIRIPCSYCGAYGLKPTFGLVPYTGIFPIELTLDHAGPIAATVQDLALLLDAIAGPDEWDPRQAGTERDDYLSTLDEGIEGFRIGIVKEGFAWPHSEPDVDDNVRATAEQLRSAGASVEDVSIPWHRDGVHIWTPIVLEGSLALMIRGNSGGTNAFGYMNTPLIDAVRRGRLGDPNGLSIVVKLVVFLAEYMQTRYGGRYYAKARNLVGPLMRAYDEALSRYDVLVMPTTPLKASQLPGPNASMEEIIARALEMLENTSPVNASGHPAISLPCAMSDGLPVGLMGIARKFDETRLLRFARACESTFAPPVQRAKEAHESGSSSRIG
jgi:amidase